MPRTSHQRFVAGHEHIAVLLGRLLTHGSRSSHLSADNSKRAFEMLSLVLYRSQRILKLSVLMLYAGTDLLEVILVIILISRTVRKAKKVS